MIKRFLDYITPANDKLKHYYTGEVPAFFGLVSFFILEQLWLLLVFGVLAGLYKELIHDKAQDKGNPEVWDFVYTALPSARNLILILIFT